MVTVRFGFHLSNKFSTFLRGLIYFKSIIRKKKKASLEFWDSSKTKPWGDIITSLPENKRFKILLVIIIVIVITAISKMSCYSTKMCIARHANKWR